MRSCTTTTLHVSRAIAILGYAAQVSVRAGSVIAHLASLNRDRPFADFDHPIIMLRCSPSLQSFAATAKSVDRRIHTTRTILPFL